jgi:predicted TIM-barrel fold metal-dependent hydrolase
MIIDFQQHLWSLAERYPGFQQAPGRAAAAVTDAGARAAEIRADMTAAGVDTSCLMLADMGLRLGERPGAIEEENRVALDLAAADPAHFVAFFGIDPRRREAAALFRAALDAGARGIKLHPGAGFSPADPGCDPLYRLAGERGVPVAIATGRAPARLTSSTGHPGLLATPAARFPETAFVLLHAGQETWFADALDLARQRENVFLELSMWQPLLVQSPGAFIGRLGQIQSGIGLHRALFGSDCPAMSAVLGLPDWVRAWRDLPALAARHDVAVSAAEAAMMLGGTAAGLLRIPTE